MQTEQCKVQNCYREESQIPRSFGYAQSGKQFKSRREKEQPQRAPRNAKKE